MSLSVTVLGESHCFSDFPGPAGVPAENSSRVRRPAVASGTTRQPVYIHRSTAYNYKYIYGSVRLIDSGFPCKKKSDPGEEKKPK